MWQSNFLSAPLKPVALHIPDGFLSTPIALIGWVLAVIIIAMALRQTRNQLGERQVPILGVMAAFIFAAQAINFPVAGGTSGHLLGGALAAIVLGPWAAVLVMTAVIGLQALIFQDGGLLALGWNIINMGVLTAFLGVFVYRLVEKLMGRSQTSLIVGGALAAWISVEAGAITTALQLALSGTSPIGIAMPAMVGVHALIGLGEAIITAGALLVIERTRPDLLAMGERAPGTRSAAWVASGLVVAVCVAALSFLASPAPDGLERVATDNGFIGAALGPVYNILPDYTVPFISNELLSGIVAVIFGTLLVFAIATLIGRTVRRSTP